MGLVTISGAPGAGARFAAAAVAEYELAAGRRVGWLPNADGVPSNLANAQAVDATDVPDDLHLLIVEDLEAVSTLTNAAPLVVFVREE